jgi:hypothetical protein
MGLPRCTMSAFAAALMQFRLRRLRDLVASSGWRTVAR